MVNGSGNDPMNILQQARGDHLRRLQTENTDAHWSAVAQIALTRGEGSSDAGKKAAIRKAMEDMPHRGSRLSAVRPAADHVRAKIGASPTMHVATGLPTLDANTRGGPLTGRILVIGGAPNTGKTSLAVQFGYRCARAGYAVAMHCVDEDRDGITFRVGQYHGLTLDQLEAAEPWALGNLADRLAEVPNFLLVDQDEDELTVEDTAEMLAELGSAPQCKGRVLIVDSLQLARTAGSHEAAGPRERIDVVTRTLKSIARHRNTLVVATSELSRAWYRGSQGRIDPMAAFKESGSIEYAMGTGLVLVGVAGEPDLVDVLLPKNKRGQRRPFRLERDARTCMYREVALPESSEVMRLPRLQELRRKIVGVVQDATEPLTSKSAIYRVVKGTKADVFATVDALLADRELLYENNVFSVPRGE